MQWVFGNKEGGGGTLGSGEPIDIASKVFQHYISYTPREWGINLGWSGEYRLDPSAEAIREWQARHALFLSQRQRNTSLAIPPTRPTTIQLPIGTPEVEYEDLVSAGGYDLVENPIGHVRLERRGGTGSGPLRYGERLALKVSRDGDGEYVVYGTRDYGINLVWSEDPVYEWVVSGMGNETGAPIDVTRDFSLYNLRAEDYVAYNWREYGINLRWESTCQQCGLNEPLQCSTRERVGNLLFLTDELFTEACFDHDMCYRHGSETYGYTRGDCDEKFRADMRRECLDGDTDKLYTVVSLGIYYETCMKSAEAYYFGVRALGGSAFREESSTYCEYETRGTRPKSPPPVILSFRAID